MDTLEISHSDDLSRAGALRLIPFRFQCTKQIASIACVRSEESSACNNGTSGLWFLLFRRHPSYGRWTRRKQLINLWNGT
jgi:hypothetical protein